MTKSNTSTGPNPRGTYILHALEQHMLNGDAYVLWDDAYKICCRNSKKSYQAFLEDLMFLIQEQSLHREGSRLYLTKTYRYEEYAAKWLSCVLPINRFHSLVYVPEQLESFGVQLTNEQRDAVATALEHRISIILGGAGSGKTTLIRSMLSCVGDVFACLLTAPTGKAARNLASHTCWEARTVHSALGMSPDDDFLEPVRWDRTRLIVVDEASMITLEMLARLFVKMVYG